VTIILIKEEQRYIRGKQKIRQRGEGNVIMEAKNWNDMITNQGITRR
jgi:hypothetical protein